MSEVSRKHALLFLIGLWLVTLTGIRSIPIERHELFVLETAQQMNSSGDWILPRFNESLRLQKPPLNYWATVLISKLDPFSTDVQIWHGRLVSLLAGLLMALLTYKAGTLFYGRKTGLIAAVLLMSTQGFIHLSHNARPDFLYGTFCALQLFAWMKAWKAADGTPSQRWSSLLGWAAAALASLTKGPQVPAVFLLGLLIFLLAGPDRKRTIRILRPLSGTVLFCVIALPWWILLNQRLQALGVSISDSQLSGSLLRNLADWKELLSGYYLWNSAVLMLPLSLLAPFLLPKFWKNRGSAGSVTRLLLTVTAVWMVVFTLGGHYRKHYLLPLLPVFALYLARALEIFAPAELPGRWRKALLALGLLAVAGSLGLLCYMRAYGMLIILPLATLLLFQLLRKLLMQTSWSSHSIALRLLPVAVLLIVLLAANNAFLPMTLPRPRHRAAEQAFAEAICRKLPPKAILVDWNSNLDLLPYYAKRTVPAIADREQLKRLLAERSAELPIFVVLRASELSWLDSEFEHDVLLRTPKHLVKVPDVVLVKIHCRKESQPGDPIQERSLRKMQASPAELPFLFLPLKLLLPMNSI